MLNKPLSKEYEKSINRVLNYILKNSKEELSLSKLADIANYSPFHFQKIFKQVTGQSPKQFIIQLRLKNAAHFLIAHRSKSITEIALDSGFSSPAVFSRAFKNFFEITPEEVRGLSLKEFVAFRKSLKKNSRNDPPFIHTSFKRNEGKKNLSVSALKINSMRVVFINTPLSDTNKIQEAYKKIIQLADTHDLLTSETKYIGIINPHAGLYQACVTLQLHHTPPKDLHTTEIEGGKFAVCKIKGKSANTFHTLHNLFQNWLPKSQYRIKQPISFEILLQDPSKKIYNNIPREIYIPIEPL